MSAKISTVKAVDLKTRTLTLDTAGMESRLTVPEDVKITLDGIESNVTIPAGKGQEATTKPSLACLLIEHKTENGPVRMVLPTDLPGDHRLPPDRCQYIDGVELRCFRRTGPAATEGEKKTK